MIIRTWRGRAAPDNAHAYPDHFRRNVLPELRTIDGFRGASLVRREHDSQIEFLVMTRWASMEAIRRFAGEDVQKAVVEPEAVAALVGFDRTVEHYELLEDVSA
jgi:heme-degrading monooxygenase HmoA